RRDHGAVPDLGEMNAIDALRLTKLSVKAIAAGCGYRDVKLFSRFFRHATGTSPQQYRRDIQRLVAPGQEASRPLAGTALVDDSAPVFARSKLAKRSPA